MTARGPEGSGPNPAHLDLVARAAWLYYRDELTQSEVAERLFVSRATVGRLLEDARRGGLVRIEVHPAIIGAVDLGRRLTERYGLAEAVVIPRLERPGTQTNARLATAAATFVRRFCHPGAVIGLGWGDTVARALTAIDPDVLDGVQLVAVSGGIEAFTTMITGPGAIDIAGRVRIMPVPMIVSSPQLAASLREEDAVRTVMALGRRAVVTLTGIGHALPGSSAARSGLVSEAEVADFAARGAVGDMLGEWFDAAGRVVPDATSQRRIGISLAELRELPNVVGVAGGVDKTEAIAAALAGGYLDVLITDESVATRLLDRSHPAPSRRSGRAVPTRTSQEKR